MKIIQLLYFYYYNLAIKLKGKKPDDSARIYISWVVLSAFLPFIIFLLFKAGLTKNRLFYFLIGSLISILIYILIKRIILTRIESKIVLERYEKMTISAKVIGLIIAIMMLIIPFIFSFWIMTLFE